MAEDILKARARNTMLFLARVAVSAIMISVVLHFAIAESVWRNIQVSSPAALVATAILLVVHLTMCVWRWRAVLSTLFESAVGFRKLSFLFGLSEIVGQVLPSFVGMDIFRAGALSRSIRLDIAVRSVVCDRVLGLLMLVVLMTVTLPGFALTVNDGAALYALTGLCAASIGGFVVLMLGRRWLRHLPFLANALQPLVEDIRRGLSHPQLFVPVMVLGLAIQLLSAVLLWTCGLTIGVELGFWNCLLIAPAGFLISSLPISLGGWGVREGALVAGFTLVGAAPSEVVAASLLYGLTAFATGGLGMAIGLLPGARPRRIVA